MQILRDHSGSSIFEVYGEDERPTGDRISYLYAERNGQEFTFGFNPDGPHAVADAVENFKHFLDLNGGKEVPDA
jgi:hypothetical protein